MQTIQSSNKSLFYKAVDFYNLDLAVKIQKQVWPDEEAKTNLEDHIKKELPSFKDYIVYNGFNPIGLTGVYVEENLDNKSIWLSWFCVLPQFRNKGFGTAMLKDTIEYAKSLNEFEFFRVNSSYWEGREAIEFYDKNLQFKEPYTVEDTFEEKHNLLIYTTNLTDRKDFVAWGNKNINIARVKKFNKQ